MKTTRSRQRILLVDGDRTRRQEMAELLQGVYHVVSALDGEMALEILKTQQDFSAILLQCSLFEISGFDVMSRLHTSRTLTTIPVVAMGEPEDELKALSLGAAIFVTMPKDPHLICYQVRNLVMMLQSDRDSDQLTGVLQWEPFLSATRDLLDEAEPGSTYVMVFLNVDRFKVFNDLFGRPAGDQLLRNLAARLILLKGVCTVGRVGGDRFALCCRKEELDLARLRRMGGELMRRLRLKYELRICFGIYEIDDVTLTVGEMCDRAQIAQDVLAVRRGQTVAYYDETLRQDLLWEQSVATQMDEALLQGQFEVYLQPVYSLARNAPISAEALVRWNHPEMGTIPPGRFIPIFERNGMIPRLDAYVWERVFQYLAELRDLGYPELSISANMSRLDIYSSDVCAHLAGLAKKYGVSPSVFRVEVTESAYLHDPQQLLDTTRRFNEAGFAVMMDDFGSGYSSLNMLMDMPVSTLKIDMGFIRAVGSDERTNCVVSSIVRMAKWLEMSVVAEGVETQVQIDYLRSIGCDRVQGYYFSKPVPKAEFLRQLTACGGPMVKKQPEVVQRSANADALWDAVTQFNKAIDGQLGALALYELAGDVLEILNVNDAYYTLMETTPAALSQSSQVATAWLGAEDQERLFKALCQAAETGQRQELLVSRYISSHQIKSLLTSIFYMGQRENRKLYMMTFLDVQNLDCATSVESRTAAPLLRVDNREDGRQAILIVEDSQVNRLVLGKMLSQDYQILEATNGKEGLDILRSRPDVQAVLLDIIMPIMDGYEFLRSKGADPQLRDIPALVLSQAENQSSEIRARELGAVGFVRKPYDTVVLRQLLRQLIGNPPEDGESR